MKIISERKKVTITNYYRYFAYDNRPLAGFTFECDKDGNVFEDKLNEAALKNYNDCLLGINGIIDKGVNKEKYSYDEPAIGLCDCGKEVRLINDYCGAAECECGQWYNIMGQKILPPKQWEEVI